MNSCCSHTRPLEAISQSQLQIHDSVPHIFVRSVLFKGVENSLQLLEDIGPAFGCAALNPGCIVSSRKSAIFAEVVSNGVSDKNHN